MADSGDAVAADPNRSNNQAAAPQPLDVRPRRPRPDDRDGPDVRDVRHHPDGEVDHDERAAPRRRSPAGSIAPTSRPPARSRAARSCWARSRSAGRWPPTRASPRRPARPSRWGTAAPTRSSSSPTRPTSSSSRAARANTATQAIDVTIAPYADLAVSNVVAPAQTIGDPAYPTISWTVTNVGTGAGQTSVWTDAVIASPTDNVNDSNAVLLGTFVHSGGLAVNQSYTQTQTFAMPPGFSGRYHLFVEADHGDVVFENGLKANNVAEAPNHFDVMPIPYADLVVSSIDVPQPAGSGQPLNVTWTVDEPGDRPDQRADLGRRPRPGQRPGRQDHRRRTTACSTTSGPSARMRTTRARPRSRCRTA